MIESRFVEVMSIRTHYLEAGTGDETVLLLHGGGVDGAELSWKLVIPVLAERYHVIAPDWPGYGKSGDTPQGMTLQNLVEFCLQFMDALNLHPCHLVGLSMGGGTALGVALSQPDRLKSLVLVDSYGLADKISMHRLSYWLVNTPWLTRLTYDWMKKSKALARWSLTYILKRPGSITQNLVDEVHQAILDDRGWKSFEVFQLDEISPTGLKSVFTKRLGELRMPVLIIHGDQDYLIPVAEVQQAARYLNNGRLVVIPKCGHWPGRDAPEEFNTTLLEFLISIERKKK
jgi:pimeloyl-ACP methyl ester carboxylesterase